MRRLITSSSLLFVALIAAWQCFAQVPQTGAGKGTPGGVVFTGIGDLGIANIVLYWAFDRCYSTSSTGNVVDITDAATGNTTGTRRVCSAGGVITDLVSGSACTFVTGNACSSLATTCGSGCRVLTVYDQSGQTLCTTTAPCNATQAANANRPTFTQSFSGGRGCATSTNAGAQALDASTFTASQGTTFTMSYVAIRTGDTTTKQAVTFETSGNLQVGFAVTANNVVMVDSNPIITAAANDNVLHAVQNVYNVGGGAGASSLTVDGTTTTGTAAGNALTNAPGLVGAPTVTGTVCEAIMWKAALTGGNITSVNGNQHGTSGYNF